MKNNSILLNTNNLIMQDIMYSNVHNIHKRAIKIFEIKDSKEKQKYQNKLFLIFERLIAIKKDSEQYIKTLMLFLSWVSYKEYKLNKNESLRGFPLREGIKKKIKNYYKQENITIDIFDEIIIAYLLKIKK